MKEDKRTFVHRLFSTIANRYDLFNALSSLSMDRRWRQVAVEAAQVGSGARVLDLCTGTGDLALACAARRREAPGAGADDGGIVGIDLCEPMLRVAQEKARKRGAAITWLFGDAQGLPFRDGTFGRVLIGFSTRNLSNLTLGLREMHRVLGPQGRLVILETGKPADPLVRAGYFLYLRTVVVLIGFLLFFKTWPFVYLQRSIARFWEPHEFARVLREVGFTQVTYRPLGGGIAALYVAVKPA